MIRPCVLLVALVSGASQVYAQDLQAQAAFAAAHFFDRTPLPAALVVAEPILFQDLYLKYLQARLGPRVGYKAGLTGSVSQRRFGAKEPILGVLLQKMLLESPAVLPANFAARPVLEADLVVRVGDEAIEQARTDSEILNCLDTVAPFVEIPDLLYAPGVALDHRQLEAVNAGARFGVLGPTVKIADMDDAYRRLARFSVELSGSDGVQAMSGAGSNLLGHPVRVVRWIRDQLELQGTKLRAGDWLSLGSITGLQPVVPGSEVTVLYLGLAPRGALEVKIKFR